MLLISVVKINDPKGVMFESDKFIFTGYKSTVNIFGLAFNLIVNGLVLATTKLFCTASKYILIFLSYYKLYI